MTDTERFIATQTAASLSSRDQLDQVFDSILHAEQSGLRLDQATVVRLFHAVVKGTIEPRAFNSIDESQNELVVRGLSVMRVISQIKPSALVVKLDDSGTMFSHLLQQLVPLLRDNDEEIVRACSESISTFLATLAQTPQFWHNSRQARLDMMRRVKPGLVVLGNDLSRAKAIIQEALWVHWCVVHSVVQSRVTGVLFTDGEGQMLVDMMRQIWDFLQMNDFEDYKECHLLFLDICTRALSLPTGRVPWAKLALTWVGQNLRLSNTLELTDNLLDMALFFYKGCVVNFSYPDLSFNENTPSDVRVALGCLDAVLHNKRVDLDLEFSRKDWNEKYDRLKASVEFDGQNLQELLVYCKGGFRTLQSDGMRREIQRIGKLVCMTAGDFGKECSRCDNLQIRPDQLNAGRPGQEEFFPIFEELTQVVANSRASVKFDLLVVLRRFVATYQPMDMDSMVGSWVLECLSGGVRSLRIASARLLPYFIRSQLPQATERVFSRLSELSQADDRVLAESTIMAYGQVAKVCSGEMLNIVLLRLLEGLLINNTLINSLTAHEMQTVAEYYDMTVYQLCSPFWSTISIDVVKRLNSDSEYLSRFADLLGISPEEFLRRTPSYTVPYLVLGKEYDIVKQISGANSTQELRDFYISHLGEILAVLLVKVLGNWRDDDDGDPLTLIQLLIYDSGIFEVDFGQLVSPFMHHVAFEVLKHYNGGNYDLIIRALQTLSSIKYRGAVEDLLNDNVVPQIVIAASNVIKNLTGRKPYTVKLQCLSAFSMLMMCASSNVTAKAVPQICANLQSCLDNPELQQGALQAWLRVVENLEDQTLRSIINLTFAVIVQRWEEFAVETRPSAKAVLEYVIINRSELLKQMVTESGVPALKYVNDLTVLDRKIERWVPKNKSPLFYLRQLLKRCEDENMHVVRQTITELKDMLSDTSVVATALSHDRTLKEVRHLMRTLLSVSSRFRDTDVAEICAQCLGIIGALDHHRVDITPENHDFVLVENFESGEESKQFVVILLEEYLIKTYKASMDPDAQLFLAWGIQELLKFCGLTPSEHEQSMYWQQFSPVSQSTLIPLLSSKYSTPKYLNPSGSHYPIYNPSSLSHSKWLKQFAFDLMAKVKGRNAEQVFHVCLRATRALNHGGLLNFLLPYAALNVILSGEQECFDNVLLEVHAVLNSPVNDGSISRASFHQTIFVLVDYLSKWMRKRKALNVTKEQKKSGTKTQEMSNESIIPVEKFLNSISPELLATKSFECKSYPRAIMYWEEYLVNHNAELSSEGQNSIYKKFQEIYSSIDDPDSLDGIAAKFPDFNADQQVIRYESTGRWNYALECYEASIQELNIWKVPDVEVRSKIFNCLKQAGRYEDLLTRLNEEAKQAKIPDAWVRLGIEVSWLAANWSSLEHWLGMTTQASYEVDIGNALMALRSGNDSGLARSIQQARRGLASEVSTANVTSLAQCHDSLIKLHALADLEDIRGNKDRLDGRLDVAGTDFTARRYLLALRRSALSLSNDTTSREEIASIWVKTAKDSRKQGQSGLALQASIRAQMLGSEFGKVENAHVLWDQGEQRKAPAMLKTVLSDKVLETLANYRTVAKIDPITRQEAKIAMLYTVWLDSSNEESSDALLLRYKAVAKLQPQWEKVHYKLAKYYNKLFDSQADLPEGMQNTAFMDGEYAGQMVLNYMRSLQYGVKYIYESMPKLVTVWLDFAANLKIVGSARNSKQLLEARAKQLQTINSQIKIYSQRVPSYIFYLVLPQLLSRILHSNDDVVKVIKTLIIEIAKKYPHQALWFIFASVHSHLESRSIIGNTIIDTLKITQGANTSFNLRHMVEDASNMTKALINLAARKVDKKVQVVKLSELGFRMNAVPSNLVVPVQNMMSTTLPTHPQAVKYHTAFPTLAKITRIDERVVVQSSLQRPKRLTMIGSDGNQYRILCKSNDDVRKDARMMEFSRSVGKVLRTDEEASRRHLKIYTYHVTPMTEVSGLIEWVDGADAMRTHILNLFKKKGMTVNWIEIKNRYDKSKGQSDNQQKRLQVFQELLREYPSVLHEWFIETFPDPSSWLEARTKFVRTAAVMSMIGYIVGLGDRHAENLLMLKKTGAVMHVDFDMLFDKGLTLAEPELVPFRLTPQLVGAMGVSGYEGLFRKSCEVTLKVLRENEGMLMTVLEPFLHEPFVDWTDKKQISRNSHTMINGLRPSRSPQEAFATIRNKIRGIRGTTDSIPLSVSGQVEYLIFLAANQRNLASMYIGWAAWL